MKKLLALAIVFCLYACGCTPKTVISQTYDFDQMNRIGVMSFTNQWGAVQGVENLFAKYLIASGFKVVERAQLESVLREHHISVSGYLSPETTREIGRILGVDVLLIGEMSSYTPARTELKMSATRRTESRPVYTQDVMQLPDGTYVGYTRNIGTRVSHSTEVQPTEYTINARVGIIAKLVDVETAEIIWIGSDDASSPNALNAADDIARALVKSFTKELAKRRNER
ncbi:MAG: CsgG/HfaB family protein [Candidatus Avelusimicrobium sp.]|uniref:CsgG/HfaB family protein n=1 Tax=Candidatus Avelusimicrobium sp. TaxID=3048833 RepID=UPI003EFE7DE6